MIAAVIIASITAYIIGALISAPKLMRLIYEEDLAELAQAQVEYEEDLARYKADRGGRAYPPMKPRSTPRDIRILARQEGFWWALVWPFALAFHALGATAFKDEIAAQHATANAKVIADYDALLASRFDKELETPGPRSIFNRIKGWTK